LNAAEPSGDGAHQQPNFENSLAALEAIVHDLEEGRLGLTDALARYEAGVKHLKHCYQLLEAAERKIALLIAVGEDGTPCTEPFDESAEPLAESAGRRRRRAKSAPSTPGPIDPKRDMDAFDDST
jgi:exodeoxyribonuclease VII small subunit